MIASRVERLAAQQHADGAFECVVMLPAGPVADRNGFTTACVLRALRAVEAPSVAGLKSRALDFLESCESRAIPGAYGFWPEGRRPAWAARVPPDADDTALILTELHRHRRIGEEGALRALCTAILPLRVLPVECATLPPWIVPGCFETWIAPREPRAPRVQVIDACVVANVAALMARLGAMHLPGYREACDAIERGLAWAGDDPARIASLTPFYPTLASFAEALAHAVECGAAELAPAARRVAERSARDEIVDAPCCSSAYGHVVWRCPALVEARALAAIAAG